MVLDSESDSESGALYAVAFHPDGVHFYGGAGDGIRRWRVTDGQEAGKQMGMDVNALSMSKDDKWIVCGFWDGASVWDAELQEKVVEVENAIFVEAVDVSPESTRFATATGRNVTNASIWSISTGVRLVGPLEHDSDVKGIKFSPDGKYIATACLDSIHIFDSYNGDQLITIKNTLPDWAAIIPIVWFPDGRLFAICEGGAIKSFDASTGSQLAEWQVRGRDSEDLMSIALSENNRFITSFAGRSVTFWDTSTHTQLGSVLEDGDTIRSIALSPDGTRLATGGYNKTITIWNLGDILPESVLPITVSTTFQMSGLPITFVHHSTFYKPLFSLNPECEWPSLSVVNSVSNITLVVFRPET